MGSARLGCPSPKVWGARQEWHCLSWERVAFVGDRSVEIPPEAPAHPSLWGRHFWEPVFKVDSSCSLGFSSPWSLGIFGAVRVVFGLLLSGCTKDWVSWLCSVWDGWDLSRSEPSWAEHLQRSWNPLVLEQEMLTRRAGLWDVPQVPWIGMQLLEWMWSWWEHWCHIL